MFKLVIFFITMVSVAVAAPSASADPSEEGKVKREVIYSPSIASPFYGANPGLLPLNYQSPLAYNAPLTYNTPAIANYAPALTNYAPALANYAPIAYNAPLAPLAADFHHNLPHNYGLNYGYVPNPYIVN